jgi:exosortase
MVEAWENNDDYSHGFFIPLVAMLMIYFRWDDLRRTTLSTSYAGLLLLVSGLMLLVISKVAAEYFSQRFSLIMVLMGAAGFLCGGQFLRLVAYPLLYLIFMIPLPAILWNKVAFPLQLFGSYLTEKIIYLFNIPVYRDGNILHLPNITLEVAAACSGLRSLLTMFALSGALVFFAKISSGRKWLLFFSAAPIAVVANIFRLTVTAILASLYGAAVAHGFLHQFSGILVFVVGLSMLLGFGKFLAK